MKTSEHNINSNVLVKINSVGRAMWKQHYAKQGKKAPELKPDSEGWTGFKLHKLMQVFGQGCFVGADLPFSANIRIEEKE